MTRLFDYQIFNKLEIAMGCALQNLQQRPFALHRILKKMHKKNFYFFQKKLVKV